MQQPTLRRAALLIIDMQIGLFNGPDRPYEGDRVLANINQLIGRARSASAPIFAMRHTGPRGTPIEPGSPHSQLIPQLEVDAKCDVIFDKTRPNCFLGTSLGEQLADANVSELIIVGMKTQYCIDATCRAASDMGLRPVLIADAHTCMDTRELPARAIIEHHNATLNGAFATLVNTDDFAF
ncbi:cysteine hydrolase [Caballeronia novacaledonica]|uniref:Cysteine hydrolase n=2 Tax=Caballeronia novacaledonica TaxID=1544861 RepID=A0AA37IDK2_9BURK|nr:cysteine hydrolase family protein [Caballeronia novacaledonica]GJH22202.1 cysteine hydrolase [Caballeronia novacaledonica]GJH27921.1 cysteine hydrolase [Caballeronia novacaledonica]